MQDIDEKAELQKLLNKLEDISVPYLAQDVLDEVEEAIQHLRNAIACV